MKFAFGMPRLIELKATMQPWELSVMGADQTRLAKLADDLGYDMISVPEHFLIPRAHVDLSGPHHFHAYAAMGDQNRHSRQVLPPIWASSQPIMICCRHISLTNRIPN